MCDLESSQGLRSRLAGAAIVDASEIGIDVYFSHAEIQDYQIAGGTVNSLTGILLYIIFPLS